MDIVMCSALGADMFDSVYPTRTGRFGVALVPSGTLKLRNTIYAEDFRLESPQFSIGASLLSTSGINSDRRLLHQLAGCEAGTSICE